MIVREGLSTCDHLRLQARRSTARRRTMGRSHRKTAKPIMQTGPSAAQKQIAKQRGTRQMRDKPRSVDDMSRKNKDPRLASGGMRDRATVKRLLMYREKAPVHRHNPESTMKQAKVAPNRQWFGNTRVIGQKELSNFREELQNKINDPYTVLLKGKKLPLSLLQDSAKTRPVKMLDVETFEETFSRKRKQKRPKLAGSDLAELLKKVDEKMESYDIKKDSNVVSNIEYSEVAKENIFNKGQSKRIWAELHKVIDSSDVLVQVLDVRDPMGTRCPYVEAMLKRPTARHKHLILILNKCDLVPTWVTSRWIKLLSAEYPTLAFHASINNPFGKGALIQLLRQFGVLHSDKKHLSVGFFGYPNVGKSSIINTLRKKRVCKAAPLAGETKVWQYVTLFRGIYLIDCPGTVYSTGDDDMTTVVKGVVRVENIDMPSQYVQGVLDLVKKTYMQRHYGLADWVDVYDFLERLARKFGKLHKGNEADIETTARMVLNDLIRGKLPFFQEPPPPPPPGTVYTKQDLRAFDIKLRQAKKDAANAPIGAHAPPLAAAAAAATARAGFPTAGGVLGAEKRSGEEEEEEEEEEVGAGRVMPSKQKLSKLLCSHRFDDADMHRGDAAEDEDEDDEDEALDSDDISEEEEEEEDGEDGDEDGIEGGSRKRKRSGRGETGESSADEGSSDDGSEVSLNENHSDLDSGFGSDEGSEEEEGGEEEDEDAAAEAAWAEMELQAEAADGTGGGGGAGKAGVAMPLGADTHKKMNRTLLRRRRKAANKKDPTAAMWAVKIGRKPSRATMLPGMEDHLEPEDCPAYGKR